MPIINNLDVARRASIAIPIGYTADRLLKYYTKTANKSFENELLRQGARQHD